MSLVPTAASKKMMLSQIASKQAENGERAGSPDVLRCSSQVQHLSPLWCLGVGQPEVSARRHQAVVPVCFVLVLLFRRSGDLGPRWARMSVGVWNACTYKLLNQERRRGSGLWRGSRWYTLLYKLFGKKQHLVSHLVF